MDWWTQIHTLGFPWIIQPTNLSGMESESVGLLGYWALDFVPVWLLTSGIFSGLTGQSEVRTTRFPVLFLGLQLPSGVIYRPQSVPGMAQDSCSLVVMGPDSGDWAPVLCGPVRCQRPDLLTLCTFQTPLS